MLKAVLFDVDGTLAETEELHRSAFNSAFLEHGLSVQWSATEYRDLLRVTGGKERLQEYFRASGVTHSSDFIRQLHEAKNRRYAHMIAAGSLQLRPGVQRLLREARDAGLRVGIATTTSAPNLEALLRLAIGPDWRARFDCAVAGDEVESKKPAPDVYLECLKRLAIRPSEALAVEDSPPGVAAARAAGLFVLATPSSYSEGQDFSAADRVVPDLGDPESPWDRDIPGFRRRWVGIDDLQALAGAARRREAA